MSDSYQTNATFKFELPEDTKIGSYPIKYRISGTSFLHLICNKEDVSFSFHPDFPEQTVLFSWSKENIMCKNYLTEITEQQQKLDSLQVNEIHNIQNRYLEILK